MGVISLFHEEKKKNWNEGGIIKGCATCQETIPHYSRALPFKKEQLGNRKSLCNEKRFAKMFLLGETGIYARSRNRGGIEESKSVFSEATEKFACKRPRGEE